MLLLLYISFTLLSKKCLTWFLVISFYDYTFVHRIDWDCSNHAHHLFSYCYYAIWPLHIVFTGFPFPYVAVGFVLKKYRQDMVVGIGVIVHVLMLYLVNSVFHNYSERRSRREAVVQLVNSGEAKTVKTVFS